MELAILLILTAVVTLFDYWAIQHRGKPRFNREDFLSMCKPRGWKQILYYLLAPISCAGVVVMLRLFYHAEVMFTLKRLVVVGLLWPVAASDYREYKIPNKLMLLGLILRVCILLPEGILYGPDLLATLMGEGIAAVGAILLCVICMLLARGSMGMGDLKLMAVMALFLGIEGTCYALFFSVFIAFLASVALLISKKKNRKDAIPFAPFILVGTIASFILSGT